MVAELLAMVAGEDDQGVVPLAGLLQEVEDAAEMVVDLGHQPEIGGAHHPHRLFVHGRAQPVGTLEEAALVDVVDIELVQRVRSEENTHELKYLMSTSYAG